MTMCVCVCVCVCSVQQSEERLEAISNIEVREWLTTTFKNCEPISETRNRPMFKTVANTLIIGSFIRTSVNIVTVTMYQNYNDAWLCSRYCVFCCLQSCLDAIP